MIEIGSIYRVSENTNVLTKRFKTVYEPDGPLVEVKSIFNKPIIDPIQPLSVEIAGMVRFVYISGDKIGVERSIRRRMFLAIAEPQNLGANNEEQ